MKRSALLILCIGLAVLFAGLGVWQVERRTWKLDLIARVDARQHAEARPIPPREAWPGVSAKDDEYRRVRVSGVLLNEDETLVQALTELGPGWWVMTPLRTDQGVVLINRGFVPPERKAASERQQAQLQGEVTVKGLLRISEPHGGFLRANDPAGDRWYSRDVTAIARARQLQDVAPFFLDADAAPNPGGYPVGGLTVVKFRNAHLIYAVTWFALCGLSLFGLFILLQRPARQP